tara:strand:- start:478 stop:1560 length:1083 start_codon:yes stop_codon:yes gene_type:complete
MNIKVYKFYLLKTYLYYFFIVSFIFLTLSFLLNILEEITFLEEFNVSPIYPFLLTFLNSPTILFELFPFIFLITSQLLFISLQESEELKLLNVSGINNLSLIKFLVYISLFVGLIIVILFYTFSSNLKYNYLSIKNKFTNDNKYLAAINDNGLWIKDEYKNNTYIINADEFKNNLLKKVTINEFDNNFNLRSIIISDEANIEKKTWLLKDVKVYFTDGKNERYKKLKVNTNFNRQKLNSIFSNLTSLNIIQLINITSDYEKLGLSSVEIKSHLYKLYVFPIYVSVMTIIGSVIMLSFYIKKSKFFYLSMGVMSSVAIYYINYFLNLLGITEKTSIILSVTTPIIILILICFILLVRINEK